MSTLIYDNELLLKEDSREHLIHALRKALDQAEGGNNIVRVEYSGVELGVTFHLNEVYVIV
ncbi:MAG: hypothetical protein GY941_21970 [Planctomycetes bacterium]|nr:hypothetical protein [Planctomycetota bacterium]